MNEIIAIVLLIVFCAVGTFVLYGIYLLENDKDEFRKKHGYKPKYHYHRKEEDDANQDQ